jgi:hypothetical protein
MTMAYPSNLNLPYQRHSPLFRAVPVQMSYTSIKLSTSNHHTTSTVFFSPIPNAPFHATVLVGAPSEIPSALLRVLPPCVPNITTVQSPHHQLSVTYCLLDPKEALLELRVHTVSHHKDFQPFYSSPLWPSPSK